MYSASTFEEFYSIMCNTTDYYESAVSYYNTAINLCGTYSELASLKTALQLTVNSCPSDPYSSSESALQSWCFDEASFHIQASYMQEYVNSLAGKIGKTVTTLDLDFN